MHGSDAMAAMWKKITVFIVMLCGLHDVAVAVDTATPMPAFQVGYILENKYIVGGEAQLSLRTDDNRYQLVLETRPTGVFRFSDKGKIREEATLSNLSPPYLSDSYSYTNFGDTDRSYVSAYDRENGLATITRQGKTDQFNIDPLAVDRLSMMLAIMQQLREDPGAKEFSIETIDRDKFQTVEFVSEGQQTLDTKIGRVEAIRIDRKRNNSNRHTVTWFANVGEQQLPVPVRIEQYKNGKLSVRLKIEKFSTSQ